MPVEIDHPYITTLQQTTLDLLANNRDPQRINRFIYRLAHNLPFEHEDTEFENIMANPILTSAVNGYLEHAEESGKVKRCLNYLLYRNPNLDSHDAEEIVYFSVWKSFFAYPWEEGFNEKDFDTLLYNSMRWLVRDARERDNAPIGLVEEGNFSPTKPVLAFDTFLSEKPINPEDYVFQQSARNELIYTLVEATTKGNSTLKELKTTSLRLLALGVEPKEIADLLGIEYPRLKTWLRACKEVDVIDTTDRIDINAGGNWHWSQKTAQVILNNPNAISLLDRRELEILERLSEGKSYTDIIRDEPSLFGAEHNIKHILRSHGANASASQESYLPRRRQLLLFLDTIEPVNDEEKALTQGIRKAKGNVYEASRILNLSRNKILYYLKKRGYFTK